MLVGSMVAFAGPASAAVPGIETVTVTSAFDSVSSKSFNVACPAGLKLVGTGAHINGATGEVVVDDLRPGGGAPPTSLLVTAYEEDPFAGNWSLTGYAVCANPLHGLVLITAESAAGVSPDFASATAVCPTNKWLVGTGAEVSGGLGEVVLDDVIPNGSATAAPTQVRVGAYEAAPDYVPNWTVKAYAICANASVLPGLARTTAVSPDGVSPDIAVTAASCPGDKKRLGMGAEIKGAGGEVVLNDLRPTTGTAIGYDADPDYVPDWTIRSYAICVNA